MTLHIVPYYAAALAVIFFLLSLNVIRGRGQYRVTLGNGGMSDLERRVRVHGNFFTEYVPFTLLLLAMTELRGLPAIVLHALCFCLLAGRLLHAWGVSRLVENLRFRASGMALTFIALGGAALAILIG